jgi:predicted Fe-Mo cluster-binding NifX family protein
MDVQPRHHVPVGQDWRDLVNEGSGSVVVAVPLDGEQVGSRWGRAERVAVAVVTDGVISWWTEHAVGWDQAHDAGTEGQHHARVVRFLRDQRVQVVAADHVGDGMVRMLATMGVALVTGAHGPARDTAVAAAQSPGLSPRS